MSDIPDVGAISNWFGSNRMNAHRPGELIGKNEWTGVVFGGGMTEVPYFQSRSIVVNDLHSHVINLAKVIRDKEKQQKLFNYLLSTPFHEKQLEESQTYCRIVESKIEDNEASMFSSSKQPLPIDEVEWAYHYFNASWMARSGSAGTEKEFNGGLSVRWEGTGGGSAKRYYSAARSLVQWRKAFRRCEFVCMDAFDFLDRALKNDKDKYDNALYNDPPFPGAGDAYKHSFEISQHEKLRDSLARFRFSKIVIRYYSTPLIEELYKDWKIIRFDGRTQTNKAAPEILITRNL